VPYGSNTRLGTGNELSKSMFSSEKRASLSSGFFPTLDTLSPPTRSRFKPEPACLARRRTASALGFTEFYPSNAWIGFRSAQSRPSGTVICCLLSVSLAVAQLLRVESHAEA